MGTLKRIFLGFGVLLLLLYGVSFGLGRYWGRDLTSMDVKTKDFAFGAKRDAQGVWIVTAPRSDDFFFAQGYLQAWDREFQLELVRLLGLGRLSSIFGDSQLGRDRFHRALAKRSQAEWKDLKPESESFRALQAFVRGVEKAKLDKGSRTPIEFQVFSIERNDLGAWEPWHVLALTRAHTTRFSYDMEEEVRHRLMGQILGESLGSIFFARAVEPLRALYAQKGVGDHVIPRGTAKYRVGEAWKPGRDSAWDNRKPQQNLGSDVQARRAQRWGDMPLPQMSGSNLWMIADPLTGREPTLCNDPHLQLTWPSPLYPIQYRIEKSWSGVSVEGLGFSLPGVPGLVIGRVSSADSHQQVAWGITIANYPDGQDLIALQGSPVQSYEESYVVRDPKTKELKEVTFRDEWSEWGPRVDPYLDWRGMPAPEPLALDWVGLRQGVRTPLEFVVRRVSHGASGFLNDLAQHWAYPSVNVSALIREQKNAAPRLVHVVPGVLFERQARPNESTRGFLSPEQARQRTISTPENRPWLDWTVGMKEAQYFVSANQRVWAGALSERLAYTWNEDSRANRLLDLMPEVIRDPKSGQIDHQSPHLMQFLKMARSLVPADELCGGVNSELRLSCLEHVSGIDAWNGQMNLDSWQASLVALWISSFRRALVPKNAFQHKAMPVLFKEWSKSSNAVRALEALMAKPEQRLLLEKELGRSFDDLVRESFRGAYAYFLNLGGSQLEWGFMHRTRWQHPFGLIPGALGVALRDSLLGPPRALPGAFDSPSAFNWVWDPKEPADFAVEHGPAMRMCTEFRADGSLVTEWAASTGPSGNPFSKWSRVFADETYFEETWVKTGLDTLSPR